MPEEIIRVPDDTAIVAVIAAQLLERLDTMNRNLEAIAEALEAIQSRLSYATTLDNQD
jgi:hypothetical protein